MQNLNLDIDHKIAMQRERLAEKVHKVQQTEIYGELDEYEIAQVLDLMSQPMRAIGSCISKGQLQDLCKQLLGQNLALQTKVNKLKEASNGKHS